ncbi:hypothetical protein Hanom_Chr11g01052611 [Helianthus anomalus]
MTYIQRLRKQGFVKLRFLQIQHLTFLVEGQPTKIKKRNIEY